MKFFWQKRKKGSSNRDGFEGTTLGKTSPGIPPEEDGPAQDSHFPNAASPSPLEPAGHPLESNVTEKGTSTDPPEVPLSHQMANTGESVREKCSVCDDPETLKTLFSQFRGKINGQIHAAQELSEKETLSIGKCIDDIVVHARDYIQESKDVFEKNFSDQNTALEGYLNFSKNTLGKQSDTVKTALTLSDDISEAGEAVDRLAGEAKLLALNATIEAARLGGTSGNAFGVISEEMNQLSNQIASTNRMIGETIQAIRESLPALMKQTNEQNEKLEEFIGAMHHLKKVIGESMSNSDAAGNTHLEMILNLSYSALSHLQFQDPMIQNLQKIDHVIRDLHKDLGTRLHLEGTAEKSEFSQLSDQPEFKSEKDKNTSGQNPGEVLLF